MSTGITIQKNAMHTHQPHLIAHTLADRRFVNTDVDPIQLSKLGAAYGRAPRVRLHNEVAHVVGRVAVSYVLEDLVEDSRGRLSCRVPDEATILLYAPKVEQRYHVREDDEWRIARRWR